MTTTTASALFTPVELRVATYVVQGMTNQQIADVVGARRVWVSIIKTRIRKRFALPGRCSTAVLAHRLVPRVVPAPTTTEQAPELDEQERRLLRALTQESLPGDIARSAGIPAQDYRAVLAGLLDKAGVDSTTLLVVRGHAWGLLDVHDRENSPIRLVAAEQTVANLLIQGVSTANIPSQCGMERTAVELNIAGLRCKLGCARASQAALAHALITRQLVPPPPAPAEPAPTLGPDQRDLLVAITSTSTMEEIAAEKSLNTNQLRAELKRLQVVTGSRDRLQVVIRCHGWGLFGTPPPQAVAEGKGR
ncbi:hypothetical protein [Streptomyces sp. NPDC003660]